MRPSSLVFCSVNSVPLPHTTGICRSHCKSTESLRTRQPKTSRLSRRRRRAMSQKTETALHKTRCRWPYPVCLSRNARVSYSPPHRYKWLLLRLFRSHFHPIGHLLHHAGHIAHHLGHISHFFRRHLAAAHHPAHVTHHVRHVLYHRHPFLFLREHGQRADSSR